MEGMLLKMSQLLYFEKIQHVIKTSLFLTMYGILTASACQFTLPLTNLRPKMRPYFNGKVLAGYLSTFPYPVPDMIRNDKINISQQWLF